MVKPLPVDEGEIQAILQWEPRCINPEFRKGRLFTRESGPPAANIFRTHFSGVVPAKKWVCLIVPPNIVVFVWPPIKPSLGTLEKDTMVCFAHCLRTAGRTHNSPTSLPEWIGQQMSKLLVYHQNGLPKKFKSRNSKQ